MCFLSLSHLNPQATLKGRHCHHLIQQRRKQAPRGSERILPRLVIDPSLEPSQPLDCVIYSTVLRKRLAWLPHRGPSRVQGDTQPPIPSQLPLPPDLPLPSLFRPSVPSGT